MNMIELLDAEHLVVSTLALPPPPEHLTIGRDTFSTIGVKSKRCSRDQLRLEARHDGGVQITMLGHSTVTCLYKK